MYFQCCNHVKTVPQVLMNSQSHCKCQGTLVSEEKWMKFWMGKKSIRGLHTYRSQEYQSSVVTMSCVLKCIRFCWCKEPKLHEEATRIGHPKRDMAQDGLPFLLVVLNLRYCLWFLVPLRLFWAIWLWNRHLIRSYSWLYSLMPFFDFLSP